MLEIHDTWWRLILLGVLLATLIGSERARPLKPRTLPLARRWADNFGLGALSFLIVRLAQPLAAAGAAIAAAQWQVGLFRWLDLPVFAEFFATLILLDLALYWQHVAFHRIPALWPYHRVHHTDRELDVSTAVRFHPVEIVLSALFKVAVVIALGAPVAAVLVFEALLTGFAMFNHANLDLGRDLDHALRRFIVTPRMHWVHHSTNLKESNRNFGFCISSWDRLFGTYQASPARGIRGIEFGVEGLTPAQSTTLVRLLKQPLLRR